VGEKMVYDVSYYCPFCEVSSDMAAWVAILISLVALVATFWQAHLARKHNILSVQPYLGGHAKWGDEHVYALTICNDGLGPAIITAGRAFCRGERIEGEGPAVIVKAFQSIPGCQLVGHEFFHPEFVLPVGRTIEVCTVKYDPAVGDVDDYLAGLLYLELDYKSVYGGKLLKYSSRRVANV